MNENTKKDIELLEATLQQIRGISGDAAHMGMSSSLGEGRFTPHTACSAIYILSDIAEQLPSVIADAAAGRDVCLRLEAIEERLQRNRVFDSEHNPFSRQPA